MSVGRFNGVATLTEFYYEKMYGHFAAKNILAVITGWP